MALYEDFIIQWSKISSNAIIKIQLLFLSVNCS